MTEEGYDWWQIKQAFENDALSIEKHMLVHHLRPERQERSTFIILTMLFTSLTCLAMGMPQPGRLNRKNGQG